MLFKEFAWLFLNNQTGSTPALIVIRRRENICNFSLCPFPCGPAWTTAAILPLYYKARIEDFKSPPTPGRKEESQTLTKIEGT